MATYGSDPDFPDQWVEDGMGWEGLAPSAEERREEREAERRRQQCQAENGVRADGSLWPTGTK